MPIEEPERGDTPSELALDTGATTSEEVAVCAGVDAGAVGSVGA